MKPFIFNADLVDPVDVARCDYMDIEEIWNTKLSLSFK